MHDFFWFNLYVVLNAALLTLLACNVSLHRMRERVPNGDGDKVVLKKAIRAHGNGVEHVAIFGLIVLGLTATSLPSNTLGFLVLTFSFARLAHALGMLKPQFNARRIGAGLTFLLELVAVVLLLVYGVL